MKSRVSQQLELLQNAQYFKIVCGAGNENAEEVKKLAYIYTLAGANGFDVSATIEVIEACNQGISLAESKAKTLGIDIFIRPFITVSVGMAGDHHVRKATITTRCIRCKKCIQICPNNAISHELIVTKELCIGCGHCQSICPVKIEAIEFSHNAKDLEQLLPKCLRAGAENIELHAAVSDDTTIMREWELIKRVNPNHFNSMCLDRQHLSNVALINRIKEAKDIAKDLFIVQADGIPMSGGKDDYQTTLQAVAIADIIYKEFHHNKKHIPWKDFYVLLSGGTNGVTAKMAKECETPYHGLSIGTHARKIIKEFLKTEQIYQDDQFLNNAIKIAKELVDTRLLAQKA